MNNFPYNGVPYSQPHFHQSPAKAASQGKAQATCFPAGGQGTPYATVPDAFSSEARCAAVQSWLEQHPSALHLQESVLGPAVQDMQPPDVPQSASLDAFLNKDVSPPRAPTVPDGPHEMNSNEQESRIVPCGASATLPDPPSGLPPRPRLSLTSGVADATNATSDHPDMRSAWDQQTASSSMIARPGQGGMLSKAQAELEIPKIERWLRAVGKARGWDLSLLDDLLAQDLAAVLASDCATTADVSGDTCAAPLSSTRISQMNPRSNPIALQSFVSQFVSHSASTAHQEHETGRAVQPRVPASDSRLPSDLLLPSKPARRGTADTLVHAAHKHLLHRPGPPTAHPHADLLRQSFELLEQRSTLAADPCPYVPVTRARYVLNSPISGVEGSDVR
jgi:hypothetical protein